MKNYILDVLLAVAVTASFTACTLRDSDPETVSEASAALASCCSSGAYICPGIVDPDVEYSFDYDPPSCGVWTKPQAKQACEQFCAATCLDTGWSPHECWPP